MAAPMPGCQTPRLVQRLLGRQSPLLVRRPGRSVFGMAAVAPQPGCSPLWGLRHQGSRGAVAPVPSSRSHGRLRSRNAGTKSVNRR
mmetsp:Transcript_14337/g.39588  ORF Transcript_14337/g.39588 Transcript_14337/m.39588 type:complete len:86 (-) Transcript_14337:7-264(-)